MKMERNIIMKKLYNQPEVQVAQFASMALMQAASPGGGGTVYTPFTMSSTTTDTQW